MKYTKTLSNLEILFWINAIRLMKTGKLARALFLMLLAGSFLIAGGLLSVACTGRLYDPIIALQADLAAPAKSGSMPSVMAANGQRNLLFIQVDRLQAENARLQGVWLLVVYPVESHVDFLPLYPASLSGGPIQDERLEAVFELGPDGAPSANFLNAFQKMDLWWDHYLVLDEIAIVNLIEWVGGVNLGEWPVSSKQTMDNLSAAFQEPRNAMVFQAVLTHELCNHIPRALEDPEWKLQYGFFAGHVASDIDLEHLLVNWPGLREYGRSLVCEFPTLPEISSTEPAD